VILRHITKICLKMKLHRHFLAVSLALLASPVLVGAASCEWTFNGGNLNDAFVNGSMTAVGATTPNIVTTNGTTIPHIGGVAAQVLNVPAFTSASDGFNLAFNASGANGGSAAYINQYTLLFDLYSPGAPGWQALFNTNPGNANDADWYIAPDNSLGIGSSYSAPNAFPQAAWTRVAFAADLAANRISFYINGTQVAQMLTGSLFDGRWSLFSNVDAGDDVRLFNEGDTSGDYTHQLYVNSVAFVDRELSAQEVGALGGANAVGILVPEPGIGALCGLAVAGLSGFGRPTRKRRLTQ
jgi:hypothetical protein